jgi:tetratricopeptide (TPR) repeat protein
MSQINGTTCGGRTLTAAAIVAALVLCAPSHAQNAAPAIGSATAKVLNDAIEALNAERYEEATNGIATLDRSTLSPFEHSKLEQILFNVAYKQKQFDEARAHLQRSIDVGGLNAQEVSQARYQSAQLFMQEQRWTEGEAALEEWLATATRPNPAAQYLLAVSRYQQNDFDGALAPARAAVETTEMPQESWLSMLSALHLQAERYHDAVPVLQQLTLVAPAKKTYWLQLSSVYGQLEDYGNAAGIMQLAHNAGLLTEDGELKRLADLLLFTGQPQRAATVLEEGIANEAMKVDDKAYEKLANSWIAAGEFDKAVAPLERGAELALTGALFVRLGEVHVKREDWAAATIALDRAITKGGLDDPGDAQFLMGVALFEQGRHAAARTSFEEARESPKHRDAADSYLAEIARLTAEGRP